jgi:hypothetical protein
MEAIAFDAKYVKKTHTTLRNVIEGHIGMSLKGTNMQIPIGFISVSHFF